MSVKSLIEKHNKRNDLVFNKKEHKYFVNEEEYISVTTLISKYFVFDEKKAAEFVAAKNLVTPKDVLDDWEKIRDKGSYIHNLADKYAKGENLEDSELDEIGGVIDFFEGEEFDLVASEIIVFSKKHKVAGTVDLILTKNNKLFIADYKTNKKPVLKDDYFDKALEPFDEFGNNKFHIYSMQLSMYSVILKEEYGVDIYDFFVVQIGSKGYNIVSLMDLRFEALEMLNLARRN
ncbi:MAG: PD-(D/E)XK nuclease family protein [Candidatus Woesearchaeota archaeon]